MLYQGLQYCYYKEDQQEVCRTTLLSLCKAQCQVKSHEVHDFLFFALSINTCLIALEAMSSERLFVNQFEEIIWNCMDMNCIWTLTSIARQTAHHMWYSIANSTSPRLPHCLSVLQPLIIKLKERDIAFFQAYNHFKDLKCAATVYLIQRRHR